MEKLMRKTKMTMTMMMTTTKTTNRRKKEKKTLNSTVTVRRTTLMRRQLMTWMRTRHQQQLQQPGTRDRAACQNSRRRTKLNEFPTRRRSTSSVPPTGASKRIEQQMEVVEMRLATDMHHYRLTYNAKAKQV